MSYASQTSVAVEKTRAEIEKALIRAGATRFMSMTEPKGAALAFELHGKLVRFALPLPDRTDKKFWSTPGGRRQRTQEDAFRVWEQACRSRWRGLYLNIKAKLEAVEIGITNFESEFLAHFVLPNNKTVGDEIIPKLEDAAQRSGIPKLMF